MLNTIKISALIAIIGLLTACQQQPQSPDQVLAVETQRKEIMHSIASNPEWMTEMMDSMRNSEQGKIAIGNNLTMVQTMVAHYDMMRDIMKANPGMMQGMVQNMMQVCQSDSSLYRQMAQMMTRDPYMMQGMMGMMHQKGMLGDECYQSGRNMTGGMMDKTKPDPEMMDQNTKSKGMNGKGMMGNGMMQGGMMGGGMMNRTGSNNPNASGTGSWVAPENANSFKNPLAGNASATEAGQKLYSQYCLICHGNAGKGDGIGGMGLNPRPADFTSDRVQSQTDGAIYWKLITGNAPMASYKNVLTETQRWQLVNYIRTFKK